MKSSAHPPNYFATNVKTTAQSTKLNEETKRNLNIYAGTGKCVNIYCPDCSLSPPFMVLLH